MTKLTLLSVNVATPKVIATVHGEEIWSGIDKEPVTGGEVRVGITNIEGDGQADLSVHGGTDKAVYAYPALHWPWWESEKNLNCRPATFGENLTLSGADEGEIRIGDRFAWGDALLEVSQPRAPCFKLGLHTARSDVPSAMTASGRCGWYMRVMREGHAPVRGELILVEQADAPSVRDAFMAALSAKVDRAALLRIHAVTALSPAWRKMIERKMQAGGE
jgi:MOSC domain-containing protein YiiM